MAFCFLFSLAQILVSFGYYQSLSVLFIYGLVGFPIPIPITSSLAFPITYLPPVMGTFVVWVIGLVSSPNYFLCYTGKQWVSSGEIVYSLFSPRISSYLSFVAFPFCHWCFLLCFWLPLGNCSGDWLLHSCCCFCSSICFVLKSLLKYISSLNLQMLSYHLRGRLMRIGEQSGISSALIPTNMMFFFFTS